MQRNEELRLAANVRKMGWGRLQGSIPLRHLKALQHMVPELRDDHQDREGRRKMWAAFWADPLAKPYMVQERLAS